MLYNGLAVFSKHINFINNVRFWGILSVWVSGNSLFKQGLKTILLALEIVSYWHYFSWIIKTTGDSNIYGYYFFNWRY